MEGRPPPPSSAPGICGRDRARPNKSTPEIALNRRTPCRESHNISVSSPKLVSPINFGLALSRAPLTRGLAHGGRHSYSTLALTVIACHSLGIYTIIVLPLLSCSEPRPGPLLAGPPALRLLLFFAFCPGRNPPFLAVKRPARPYKSPIQTRFAMGNAEGA